MGKYDRFLSGLSPEQPSSASQPAQKQKGAYDRFLSGLSYSPDLEASNPPDNQGAEERGFFGQKLDKGPAYSENSFKFEKSPDYPTAKMTDTSIGDIGAVDLALKAPSLIYGLGRAGVSGVSKLAGKAKDLYSAPAKLEEALASSAENFGTSETPSMVGNAVRAGKQAEDEAAQAMAEKLYGEIDKNYSVSTRKLAEQYQSLADELSPGLQNAIKKNIQLGENPVRAGDVGEFRGVTTKVIPGETTYGVGYQASPGTPTQLPEKKPLVADLIRLRSKLGATSKQGGIEGYNAWKLKEALDADIANIGEGEGALGKMANDITNVPLKRATGYYKQLIERESSPLYKSLSNAKVDDIPNIIFKKGRTSDVNEARALIGEEGFSAAKKSFFNEIINSKDVSKELAKYSKNNSDFLQSVFKPQEIDSLRTVANLQKRASDAAKTVTRAKTLLGASAALAVGGGIVGKAAKFGIEK